MIPYDYFLQKYLKTLKRVGLKHNVIFVTADYLKWFRQSVGLYYLLLYAKVKGI